MVKRPDKITVRAKLNLFEFFVFCSFIQFMPVMVSYKSCGL